MRGLAQPSRPSESSSSRHRNFRGVSACSSTSSRPTAPVRATWTPRGNSQPATSRVVSSTSRRTRRHLQKFDCGTLSTVCAWLSSRRPKRGHPTARRSDPQRVVLGDVVDPLTGGVPDHGQHRGSTRGASTKSIEDALASKMSPSAPCSPARRDTCRLRCRRDLARGYRVNIGEAVGIIAARSIPASPVRSSRCARSTSAAPRRGSRASYLEARAGEPFVSRRAQSSREEGWPDGGDEAPRQARHRGRDRPRA
jgi:hypothetical protein